LTSFKHHATMRGMEPTHRQPAIRAVGLEKRFGDVQALCGIDLEVPSGSVLGLLGPNGAGKTTTVRILTTSTKATGGRAEVLGIDVARDPDAVRNQIGLAGQYAAVDGNLNGRENLELIGKLTHVTRKQLGPRVDALLEQFGLTRAAERLVRTYSGGMRRRLDLAAALVHHPPVLFLDEPTTGLDPQGRNNLWEVIEQLAGEGTTILLTTQYLEEADRLADDIVVIDGGRVIAQGTPAELKARLGATVVEVGFGDEHTAARAAATVEPYAVRPVERTGHAVHLEVADGPRQLMAVLRSLDGERLEPLSLVVREPSLDDVFLSLTGRRAEGDSEEDGTDERETAGHDQSDHHQPGHDQAGRDLSDRGAA
jgi:daunorubicin resistance ABC transporter ATP-binding subunit